MDDGGVIALTGYLYQLLGSVALAVHYQGRCTVMSLEKFGEDAIIACPDKTEVIQFKYSAKREVLTPRDLARILLKLDTVSKSTGFHPKIVTNRPLSPSSKEIIDNAQLQHAPQGVKSSYFRALKQLWKPNILDTYNFSDFYDAILKCGREFGLSDEEITRGSESVIAFCVAEIERRKGCDISIQTLEQKIVGFKHPAKLTAATLYLTSAEHIKEVCDRDGPAIEDAIPRAVINDIFTNPAPVIVVLGHGGSGKTLSVLETLHRHVVRNRQVGVALLPRELQHVSQIITKWRKPDVIPDHTESFERSLTRVMVANPNCTPPLFFISIDGLDESDWISRNAIHEVQNIIRCALRRVLTASGQPFPIKVVVTCRDKSEFEYLTAEGGIGTTSHFAEAKYISLGEFDRVEFESVWSKWFPILPIPSWREPVAHFSEYATDLATDNVSTPANDKVISALKNPVMLGAFRTIGDLQRDFLKGDQRAWNKLLETHVDWFVKRVNRRKKLDGTLIKSVLSSVARATCADANRNYLRDEAWNNPAREAGVSLEEARQLFVDAVTAGLLVTGDRMYLIDNRTPQVWRWQYPFVCEYLSSQF